ncbi:MAG: AAA family ATPase [Chloroflexi bacterium]|nr:AAA family ATPase [Chloroflexota bacterium]
MQKVIVDDLDALLTVVPGYVHSALQRQDHLQDLLEVVLDLGRSPLARFPGRDLPLDSAEVTEADLQYVVSRIGAFGQDNRAGIERTLHRISCIRNRGGEVVGLTCRVGRAVFGTIKIIEDMVFSGSSILLLGRPGVGKTTMLREVARVLADAGKRVMVVDTSNEIAGDGDIPHPAIGRARRMQVRTPDLQHSVMIEAVENHMPEVIIIDEMGTELEATAARTIAERGVQLVATAHGNTLDNLIMNPTLSDLIGGVQSVTLGDEEARRRGTQKTMLERKAPPTFNILVEIQTWDRVASHTDVAATVDALLRGYSVTPEVRWLEGDGQVHRARGEAIALTAFPSLRGPLSLHRAAASPSEGFRRRRGPPSSPPPTAQAEVEPASVPLEMKVTRVFPFGISRDKLLHSVRYLGAGVEVVETTGDADLVLTTKAHYRRKPDALKAAEEHSKPIYVLRKNSPAQIQLFLQGLSKANGGGAPDPVSAALAEAEDAVEEVMRGDPSVELSPQSSYVRRLQHQLAERYNLSSASTGREPKRRVIIFRT